MAGRGGQARTAQGAELGTRRLRALASRAGNRGRRGRGRAGSGSCTGGKTRAATGEPRRRRRDGARLTRESLATDSTCQLPSEAQAYSHERS